MLGTEDAPVPTICETCGMPSLYFFTLEGEGHYVCSKRCALILFACYFDTEVEKLNEEKEYDGDTYVSIGETMNHIAKEMRK